MDEHETGWTASTPLPGETRLRSPAENGNVAICEGCAELALEILKQ